MGIMQLLWKNWWVKYISKESKEIMALRVGPIPQICNVRNHGIGHLHKIKKWSFLLIINLFIDFWPWMRSIELCHKLSFAFWEPRAMVFRLMYFNGQFNYFLSNIDEWEKPSTYCPAHTLYNTQEGLVNGEKNLRRIPKILDFLI